MVNIIIVYMYNGLSGKWLILVWVIRSRIEIIVKYFLKSIFVIVDFI